LSEHTSKRKVTTT